MMDTTGQLLLTAEIAVALAGFAGIVASFQYRAGASMPRGLVLGLDIMITNSLGVALFAILPMALSNFGIKETVVWSIFSGLLVPIFVVVIFKIKKRFRKVPVGDKFSRLMFSSWFVAAYLIVTANFLNVVNVLFHREFGPYFVSLVFTLSLSGYMFSRLVVRPLWIAVHKQEAEQSSTNDPG
jgi:hypothetical protein